MNIRDIVAARRAKDPSYVEIIDGFETIDLSAIPIDAHSAEPCDDPHFAINDGFDSIDLLAIPIDTHLPEPSDEDDDDLHPWAAWEGQAEEESKPDLELSTACPQCAADHWCSRHAYRHYAKRKVLAFRRRRQAERVHRVWG